MTHQPDRRIDAIGRRLEKLEMHEALGITVQDVLPCCPKLKSNQKNGFHNSMIKRDFVQENEAARVELSQLISRLDEHSFRAAIGSGWTVATSLCHLAFWDERVLSLLRQWESSGKIEARPLSSQSIDSINHAVNTICQAVPGPAAGRLALCSAVAVDSRLTEISDEFADELVSAGFERFLRRSLHRREHIQKIREALQLQPARES